MTRTIKKTIRFKRATPKHVFDIYMDAEKHAELIGAKVTIGRKEGEKFTAFDGFVKGRNLMIVPNRLIVQSWRGSVWKKDDPDSVLVLLFEKTSEGARIRMTHADLPPQFEERWDELYWKPLQEKIRSQK